MLRIDSIKLPPEAGMAELAAEAARLLRMREKDILSLRLLRRSVDAREEVRLVYTVEVAVKEESAILRRARSRKISRAAQAPAYTPPSPLPAPAVPPVVVGAGPAGLFAALVLAQAGLRPILLERGRPVEQRRAALRAKWRSSGKATLGQIQAVAESWESQRVETSFLAGVIGIDIINLRQGTVAEIREAVEKIKPAHLPLEITERQYVETPILVGALARQGDSMILWEVDCRNDP